jgi:hypothetical protein
MDYRNAVFVVTSEDSCPIYNTGEELQVQDAAVSVDYEKPVCMFLVQELIKIVSKKTWRTKVYPARHAACFLQMPWLHRVDAF